MRDPNDHASVFPVLHWLFNDFILRCSLLRRDRVQALAHPYFETYHNEADEPLPAKPASFDFEDIPLSRETLKARLPCFVTR